MSINTRTPDAAPVATPAMSTEDLRILGLIAEGYPMATIAQRLNLSGRTVRRRTRALCDQLGARSPIQVAVWAARRGLI